MYPFVMFTVKQKSYSISTMKRVWRICVAAVVGAIMVAPGAALAQTTGCVTALDSVAAGEQAAVKAQDSACIGDPADDATTKGEPNSETVAGNEETVSAQPQTGVLGATTESAGTPAVLAESTLVPTGEGVMLHVATGILLLGMVACAARSAQKHVR